MSSEPTIRGAFTEDHIEKPSEVNLADSRKAMHVRHKAKRKQTGEEIRTLLKKLKAMKLVPEDDREEEKEEMETMGEKLRRALDGVL
jgi:hypothetical protein